LRQAPLLFTKSTVSFRTLVYFLFSFVYHSSSRLNVQFSSYRGLVLSVAASEFPPLQCAGSVRFPLSFSPLKLASLSFLFRFSFSFVVQIPTLPPLSPPAHGCQRSVSGLVLESPRTWDPSVLEDGSSEFFFFSTVPLSCEPTQWSLGN